MSKFLYCANGIIPFDSVDYIGYGRTFDELSVYTKSNDTVPLIKTCSDELIRLIIHDLKIFLLYDENLCFDFTKYYKGDDNNDQI